MFVRNAVAGYLMPELMEQGIAVYYKHVLQKKYVTHLLLLARNWSESKTFSTMLKLS